MVNGNLVLRIRDSLPLEEVTSILCAGVTLWQLLSKHEVGAGNVVGVVGTGGLAHTAIHLIKEHGAVLRLE